MRLKIWNIAELYPPGYGGGAAIYVYDTCRFLANRGHDVRVLCTEAIDAPAYSIRDETVDNVKVYRINLPYFRNQDPGGWFLSTAQWKEHCFKIKKVAEKVLTDWQPDLVQFHTPYSLIEECYESIERYQIPIVGMTHDAWVVCLRTSLFKSPTDTLCDGPSTLGCLECQYSYFDGSNIKAVAKLPWRVAKLGIYPAYRLRSRNNLRHKLDGLICVSKFMLEAHNKNGLVSGILNHIPLGIDLTNLPKNFPARPREPLRFGFVAGYVSHKGIWDVLDVVASLKGKGLKFELHIWGPNQDILPLIERDIKDCVVLRGLFTPDEKWDVYSEMDVLLMATRWAEPYGRVIQEAAAAKVPSIAPKVGGITEQIRDGVDGLLFNFRDKADLERQMIALLKQPDLLLNLRANLWQVIDTREAVVGMEELYLKVIEARAKLGTATFTQSSFDNLERVCE